MRASRVWLQGCCAVLLAIGGFVACGSSDEHQQTPSNGGDASAGETTTAGNGVGAVGATSSNGGDGQTPGGKSGSAGAGGGESAGGAGGGDGPTSDDDLGALSAFCKGFAETECAARNSCYPDSDPGCVPRTISDCHEYARAEVLPAIKAGLVVFHPEKQAGCFKLPKAGFCGVNNLWFDADCAAAFTGTASGDDPCFQVYFLGANLPTCAAAHCDATPEKACGSGRCVPYLVAGETCLSSGAAIPPGCGVGLVCDATTKKCAAEKTLHAACTSVGDACNHSLPQLTCVPKADGKGGLECDVPRAEGGFCGTPDVQLSSACTSSVCRDDHCVNKDLDGNPYCFSNVCAKGQACFLEPANPVCRTALTKGKVCRTVGKECSPELTCVAGADPAAGTCQARVGAGKACGQTAECTDGLSCVTGASGSTCRTLVGKGKACAASGECAGGLRCLTTGLCGDPILVGDPCPDDADCDGGSYCDDASSTCQPWKRNGEPCTRRQECVYFEGCSDAGVCASRQCTVDSEP